MMRLFTSKRWALAVVAIAIVGAMASEAEARGRWRRRFARRQPVRSVTKAVAKPARPLRSCPAGGTCRPQQSQTSKPGDFTPLPASFYDEPPLPQIVIEPADLAPVLSPRS